VLLVWLVATRLLLRQLSLQVCHKRWCLLVWLLCRHHLLPHALLQQKDDTANNAAVTFFCKASNGWLTPSGGEFHISMQGTTLNSREVHVGFMVNEVSLG
jgi:hypothetical protein